MAVRLADEREPASGGSNLDAKVAAPENAPVEDMLAPELVFTKDKDKDKTGTDTRGSGRAIGS